MKKFTNKRSLGGGGLLLKHRSNDVMMCHDDDNVCDVCRMKDHGRPKSLPNVTKTSPTKISSSSCVCVGFSCALSPCVFVFNSIYFIYNFAIILLRD